MIIGVDPGAMTGMFSFTFWEAQVTIVGAEIEAERAGDALRASLIGHNGDRGVTVVYERFDIDDKTAKKSAQHDALDVIGVIKDVSRTFGVRCVPQGRSDAKHFGTNRLLKRLGWYVPGKRHQNDAARQVALQLADRHLSLFDDLVR